MRDQNGGAAAGPAPSNLPNEQAEGLRGFLSRCAAGTWVVTGLDRDGQPVGFTTSALAPVSADPAMFSLAVPAALPEWLAIEEAGQMLVHALAAGDGAIAEVFAAPGVDRFGAVGWRPRARGSARHPRRQRAAAGAGADRRARRRGAHAAVPGRGVAAAAARGPAAGVAARVAVVAVPGVGRRGRCGRRRGAGECRRRMAPTTRATSRSRRRRLPPPCGLTPSNVIDSRSRRCRRMPSPSGSGVVES
ncbi:flavin reductase family protein [Corynebacterium sp. 335C]